MSAYLTPGAAAKVLGVSTQSLVNWVERGHLSAPVLTEGGHRRYHRGEVLRLADGLMWQALAEHRGSELVAVRGEVEVISRACASLGDRVERLLGRPDGEAAP